MTVQNTQVTRGSAGQVKCMGKVSPPSEARGRCHPLGTAMGYGSLSLSSQVHRPLQPHVCPLLLWSWRAVVFQECRSYPQPHLSSRAIKTWGGGHESEKKPLPSAYPPPLLYCSQQARHETSTGAHQQTNGLWYKDTVGFCSSLKKNEHVTF